MGTISAFINVSLAFYYYRVIKLGHSETRIKRQRILLFVCPIIVGLTFAFAGIPFYDMVCMCLVSYIALLTKVFLSSFTHLCLSPSLIALSLVQQQCILVARYSNCNCNLRGNIDYDFHMLPCIQDREEVTRLVNEDND